MTGGIPLGRWRTGRKVTGPAGRTIYIQRGAQPSDDDLFVGLMDSAVLARWVCDQVNANDVEKLRLNVLTEHYAAPDDLAHEGPRGVQVTHLPSGLVERCHEHRSRLQNTVKCMETIQGALAAGVPWPSRAER